MDILASFLQGQQAGQQQRGYRKEQNNLAKMEALATRIVQGDPGAYAEAAAIDPVKANAYQGANDAQMRKLKGFVDYVNGARKSGNAAAVNAALQQGAPFITQLTGKPAPTEWTPDMDAGWAQLEAQVAMLGADPAQGTLQSQKIGADGFIYNTYRDGRMVNTGIKADRQMWLRDFPGMDPQLVGKDGSILPVGQQGPQQVGAPSQAAPQRSDMEADIELANSMIAAGIPEAQVDAFLAQRGQRAGPAAVASQPIMAGGSGLARPSAAQEAAATEAAKLAVQLQYLPQTQAIETQGAIDRARGVEQAKGEVERAENAPKRIKAYEQALGAAKSVTTSIDNALKLIGPTTTGFIGARARGIEGSGAYNLAAEIETVKANLGFDRLQQMRDNSPTGGALGSVAVQELVALQSTIANLDPNQSAEQIKANLERVKQHYTNWQSAVRQALAEERAQQQAPRAPAQTGQPAPAGKSFSNLWN